jgi:hypothetical protein
LAGQPCYFSVSVNINKTNSQNVEIIRCIDARFFLFEQFARLDVDISKNKSKANIFILFCILVVIFLRIVIFELQIFSYFLGSSGSLLIVDVSIRFRRMLGLFLDMMMLVGN